MNLLIPEVTIEECAEVIQAISKVIRFGVFNSGYDNRKALSIEVGQLLCMLHELEIHWDLDTSEISKAYNAKSKALLQYAKYNVCNQTVVD